ncbi:hypothetical protein EDD18DRAFT_1364006 [Armillaria luteobubalina]|uniref:Ecp2 effector protein domain-containing protein n=1 Tax=Armillaria luteobubalina TaxID=153913 RepID=A0AA39P932_9AGAR|nr:hypothetical protein EDD18DRAFT_1364006 [Armillaria luteobubalina]
MSLTASLITILTLTLTTTTPTSSTSTIAVDDSHISFLLTLANGSFSRVTQSIDARSIAADGIRRKQLALLIDNGRIHIGIWTLMPTDEDKILQCTRQGGASLAWWLGINIASLVFIDMYSSPTMDSAGISQQSRAYHGIGNVNQCTLGNKVDGLRHGIMQVEPGVGSGFATTLSDDSNDDSSIAWACRHGDTNREATNKVTMSIQ